MTITVDPKLFRRAVALASGPVDRRPTVPILGTIRCRANGLLQLESSDVDTTTRVELPYTGEAADLVLPEPHRLQKALDRATGDTIELRRGSGHPGVPMPATTEVTIQSGAFATTLNSLYFDDHPGAELVHFPEWSSTITAADLRNLARLRRAISKEETRYYLNGVCLAREGETWRFAATDGHRLKLANLAMPDAEGEVPDGVIFPRRWFDLAIKAFARSKEPLRLVWGRTAVKNSESPDLPLEPGGYRIQLSGTVDGVAFTLASRLIDGTYPDITRVIPSATANRFTIRRADLIRAIRTLSPLATDKIRAFRLAFNGKGALACSIQCPSIGTSTIEIPAKGNTPLQISFNGQYLRDAADALTGEDMIFECNSAVDPAIITDPADNAFRVVLMPMRV